MGAAVRWCLGFFSNTADQSMTRLVTLLCCVAGVLCAIAAFVVATIRPLDQYSASVIAALASLAAAFIAGGVVALVNRTKATDGLPPGANP